MSREESLIPVKGIDVERRKHLSQMGILTSPDLLQQGRSIEQRKNIAINLLNMEMGIRESSHKYESWKNKYIKYVNSWVKQINLWGVNGMDPDTAYFLVELGVRHIEDLSKVDANKAYDIMICLHNNQPQFKLLTIDKLENLIKNSKTVSSKNPEYQERLIKRINHSLVRTPIKSRNLKDLKTSYPK